MRDGTQALSTSRGRMARRAVLGGFLLLLFLFVLLEVGSITPTGPPTQQQPTLVPPSSARLEDHVPTRAATPPSLSDDGEDDNNDDEKGVTLVLMSYPKSKRHHLLIDTLRRMLPPPGPQRPTKAAAAAAVRANSNKPAAGEQRHPQRSRWRQLFSDHEDEDADMPTDDEAAVFRRLLTQAILVWNGPWAEFPSALRAACVDVGGGGGGIDPDAPIALPAPLSTVFSHEVPFGPRLRVLVAVANRVDNRWMLGSYVRTSLVLNVDDDIALSGAGAACLVSVRQALPADGHALVAADVRSHCFHSQQSCKDHEYSPTSGRLMQGSGAEASAGDLGYAARHLVRKGRAPDAAAAAAAAAPAADDVMRTGPLIAKMYSVALPRALVLGRETMQAYERAWRDASTGLRDLVDELRCDDIALNFIAANASSTTSGGGVATTVYAKARYTAHKEGYDGNSMHKEPGMKAKRQQCVNQLAAIVRRTQVRTRRRIPTDRKSTSGGVAWPRLRSWHVSCSVDG